MDVLRFFKMASVRHIGFLKVQKILTVGTVRRANMSHHAKFRINRSNNCRDMSVFLFVKMSAVQNVIF